MSGFRHTETPRPIPLPAPRADAQIAIQTAASSTSCNAPTRPPAPIRRASTQVRAGFNDELDVSSLQPPTAPSPATPSPLRASNVFVIAKDATNTASRQPRRRGRVTMDFFEGDQISGASRTRSSTHAILQLGAIEAPAGEMPVVLGPRWPAFFSTRPVGHGLEADFNRKKTSAFAGLIGQQVAVLRSL